MKVVVAGSRKITHQPTVERAILLAFNEWLAKDQDNWKWYFRPEIVSGGAYGVDFCGEVYANKHKLPLTIFKAQWDLHGKRAGFLRNEEMANYADALIAVWDGESRGTKHMIDSMKKRNKLVFVYEPPRSITS
jgi:hypothetical protein